MADRITVQEFSVRPPTEPTLEHRDILIIDDQYDNLALLDRLLTQNGYHVRVARDGASAIRAARAQKPDLIMLDVRLPGLNGFEVCAQLKADRDLADVPVLFISASHDTMSKLHAFEAGGVDYITKPIQVQETLARVKTHLTLAHLRRQEKELVLMEERQRLARDLHDSVKQTLFMIGATAEALQLQNASIDPNLMGQLKNLHSLAQAALSEMNIMLFELLPQQLAERSLDDLLTELTQSFSARTRAEVRLIIGTLGQPLPPPIKTTFYRVAQEAMNNAIKHARASHIDLKLVETTAGVELIICDDGLGFDVNAISVSGFGLYHMRERASENGSYLLVDSQPGHGTTVKLVWSENHGG